MNTEDLIIEIGTEELPPKLLATLSTNFSQQIISALNTAKLEFAETKSYCTPRRLALLVCALTQQQPSIAKQRRGPSVSSAFDQNQKPTPAALGFARSCNVEIAQLQQLETDKGAWLVFNETQAGQTVFELLPDIINHALKTLPSPKKMRWGNGEEYFIRPIHWILLKYGKRIVEGNFFGIPAADLSYGHRVHHPQAITIDKPIHYEQQLKAAYVLANFNERKQNILDQINTVVKDIDGCTMIDDALLDEVTALVEYPVVHKGYFNSDFLALPKEVLMVSMQSHQKYFPMSDQQGKLLNSFIMVANLQSRDGKEVVAGNERVIQPRLADAAFFWQRDQHLDHYIDQLSHVIEQKELGTLADKVQRCSALAKALSQSLDVDNDHLQGAIALCKCDLLTGMVGEFPELQGIMGYYYAKASDETEEVAVAIKEHYHPRFSGDSLPSSKLGCALALIDRLDTIVGIFSAVKEPSGDKDPYGLRRRAIGVIRLLLENNYHLDLNDLIQTTAKTFSHDIMDNTIQAVLDFLWERLRYYYLERSFTADQLTAVFNVKPATLIDFDHRLHALQSFSQLQESASLAAANKRIRNMLKKNNSTITDIQTDLLVEPAEIKLAQALTEIEHRILPLLEQNDYQQAMIILAGLKDEVDQFFDKVMVMTENTKLKNNRLALLHKLNKLFLRIADISELRTLN